MKKKEPAEVKLENDFQERANAFLAEIKVLEKKYKLTLSPIIQPYGPDFRIADAGKTEEEKKQELVDASGKGITE